MVAFLWKVSPPRVAQASLYALLHSIGTLRIIFDHLRMSSFHLSSCVRRYNVSKDVWSALAGAVLHRERENETAKDFYSAAVQKDGLTVGHVPHTISCLCSVCVRRWLNIMHDYWSVDYSSWQVLGNDVYGL